MTRWSRWRKRALACTLALIGAWSSGACGGESEEAGDDDAGGGAAASGGTGGARGGSGGTVGVGGVAGSYCDGYQCLNGMVTIGPCVVDAFTRCDRTISGVDCVTSGDCPILGTGGTGGAGGAGGAGGTSGAGSGGTGGSWICDGICCSPDGTTYLCVCSQAVPITFCDRAVSGVDCVASGMACPNTGGAGGEPGGGGESGAG
jgi:hypothetical protein